MTRSRFGPSVALSVALLMAAATLSACGSDTSRVDSLAELAHDQAIPQYRVAAVLAKDLDSLVGVLCDDPSGDGVEETGTGLVDLRLTLAGLEAFRHGPAMDERDQGRINTAIEPDAIEALIETVDAAIFDAHYVSTSIGATKRGLYAIEYVLFVDDPQTSAERLGDPSRCLYLRAITGAVLENVDNTLIGWTDGGEIKLPYTEVLASEKNAQDNINVAVETSVFLLRKIVNMELAPALGLVGTEADLTGLAEGEGGQGLPVLYQRLESVRFALVGEVGLANMLSDELTTRLQSEITAAQAQIESLISQSGQSLSGAILDAPSNVETLHDLISTIERTVSTEVVGELDVVVGFSDADGDSAN